MCRLGYILVNDVRMLIFLPTIYFAKETSTGWLLIDSMEMLTIALTPIDCYKPPFQKHLKCTALVAPMAPSPQTVMFAGMICSPIIILIVAQPVLARPICSVSILGQAVSEKIARPFTRMVMCLFHRHLHVLWEHQLLLLDF